MPTLLSFAAMFFCSTKYSLAKPGSPHTQPHHRAHPRHKNSRHDHLDCSIRAHHESDRYRTGIRQFNAARICSEIGMKSRCSRRRCSAATDRTADPTVCTSRPACPNSCFARGLGFTNDTDQRGDQRDKLFDVRSLEQPETEQFQPAAAIERRVAFDQFFQTSQRAAQLDVADRLGLQCRGDQGHDTRASPRGHKADRGLLADGGPPGDRGDLAGFDSQRAGRRRPRSAGRRASRASCPTRPGSAGRRQSRDSRPPRAAPRRPRLPSGRRSEMRTAVCLGPSPANSTAGTVQAPAHLELPGRDVEGRPCSRRRT